MLIRSSALLILPSLSSCSRTWPMRIWTAMTSSASAIPTSLNFSGSVKCQLSTLSILRTILRHWPRHLIYITNSPMRKRPRSVTKLKSNKPRIQSLRRSYASSRRLYRPTSTFWNCLLSKDPIYTSASAAISFSFRKNICRCTINVRTLSMTSIKITNQKQTLKSIQTHMYFPRRNLLKLHPDSPLLVSCNSKYNRMRCFLARLERSWRLNSAIT